MRWVSLPWLRLSRVCWDDTCATGAVVQESPSEKSFLLFFLVVSYCSLQSMRASSLYLLVLSTLQGGGARQDSSCCVSEGGTGAIMQARSCVGKGRDKPPARIARLARIQAVGWWAVAGGWWGEGKELRVREWGGHLCVCCQCEPWGRVPFDTLLSTNKPAFFPCTRLFFSHCW